MQGQKSLSKRAARLLRRQPKGCRDVGKIFSLQSRAFAKAIGIAIIVRTQCEKENHGAFSAGSHIFCRNRM